MPKQRHCEFWGGPLDGFKPKVNCLDNGQLLPVFFDAIPAPVDVVPVTHYRHVYTLGHPDGQLYVYAGTEQVPGGE
jgi:hypothetical protein